MTSDYLIDLIRKCAKPSDYLLDPLGKCAMPSNYLLDSIEKCAVASDYLLDAIRKCAMASDYLLKPFLNCANASDYQLNPIWKNAMASEQVIAPSKNILKTSLRLILDRPSSTASAAASNVESCSIGRRSCQTLQTGQDRIRCLIHLFDCTLADDRPSDSLPRCTL
jgi:hypothetical protein